MARHLHGLLKDLTDEKESIAELPIPVNSRLNKMTFKPTAYRRSAIQWNSAEGLHSLIFETLQVPNKMTGGINIINKYW